MDNSMAGVSIPLVVRSESRDDIPAIRRVVTAAFGQTDEADLVDDLRDGGHLFASSVVLTGNTLIGHAALSIGHIAERRVLVLAPVAVTPRHQGCGAGTAVVRHLLVQTEEPVTVLGDPSYYSRFGFEAAEPSGVTAPFPTESGALQLLNAETAPTGIVEYPESFSSL